MSAMFSPGELEGEVDHSFFDSDCDDRTRDEKEKMEKGLKAEKESPPAHERLLAKQTENTKNDGSLWTDGPQKQLTPDNNSGSRAERNEKSSQSKEEERSRVSSKSLVRISNKVINNSSDSDEDSNLHSKRSKGTFMALLAEAREADCKDVYSQSPNESEESLPSKHSDSKGKNKQSPKKLIRNWRTRTPSPTSTESSVDADSENSYSSSSSDGRSSLDSPAPLRPNKPSLSPGERGSGVGSAGSQGVPISHTEESEDTVTDVSPLSSPDLSPLQSLDLNHTEAEEGSLKEQKQQEESVPSSGLSSIHQDEDSDQDGDDCSLSLESQLGGKLVLRCAGGRNRKNYSFTNDEVQRIDRENQRLLRELSRHSPGSRPGSQTRKKTHLTNKSPHIRLSHSALNRQREQQRIERENLAFLKRLESVKPTPGLKRSEQLQDYQRHAGYLGGPSYSVCLSTTKKERCTSRTPSGPRPTSSAHHSSRAASTSTESGRTSVPRSKKTGAARPAWC
ncbi:cilia- and flagella-associated protein 97 isoform X2 [Plectropomus leopardus]|uniref:cilia- and flagella-associated protein 97 isoform X2 n=1 Tax=Plectropomus leopardus TaxID=160734 RepID=UPI001C4AEADC|nr:cilia- and flagella-associated protein 97 isoform X2 [Plectropomus leopardus]